jgi:cytidylate kinase
MNQISLKDRASNINNDFVIALDGTSASGKGAISNFLATRYSLTKYASSIVYRTLASYCNKVLKDKLNQDDIIALSQDIDNIINHKLDDLYSPEITSYCSIISAIKEVRSNLYHVQRAIISQNKRIVMDGRDIGTVIAPDAHLKIFTTADISVRAKRRFLQMQNNNKYSLEEVKAQLLERDTRDQSRECSPMLPAKDAFIIDTTNLNLEEVESVILNYINERA